MISLLFTINLVLTVASVIGYKQNNQINRAWQVWANLGVIILIGAGLLPFLFMKYHPNIKNKRKVNIPDFMFNNTQFFKLKTRSTPAKKVYDFTPKKKYDFTKK